MTMSAIDCDPEAQGATEAAVPLHRTPVRGAGGQFTPRLTVDVPSQLRPDVATLVASFDADPQGAPRQAYLRLLATAETVRAELADVVQRHGALSANGRMRRVVPQLATWSARVGSLIGLVASASQAPAPSAPDPVAAVEAAVRAKAAASMDDSSNGGTL